MTVKTYGNFIANKWQDATGGELIAVRDPSNGQEFARIARGTPDDIDLAVHSARAALSGDWGRMTPTERGRVLTRMQLIDRVWGSDYVGDTKTLDVHVKRLRAKIEPDPSRPQHIVTVRGLGYKFEEP